MSAWDEIDALRMRAAKNVPPRVKSEKSPDRNRTVQAQVRIANGFHPFGLRLREPAGETCGTCKHLVTKQWSGTYFKCAKAGNTNGPATDCRKKWPACLSWEPKP